MQKGADDYGGFGQDLEMAGDAHGHQMIVDAVRQARPDDAVLSEEGADDGTRVSSSRAWIIDPLDGSAGFGQGNGEWAVHVALSIDGKPAVGAVAAPAIPTVGSTGSPHSVPKMANSAPTVVTGRSRAWREGQLIADALGGKLIACSSAGVKAMLVLTGVADVYVHDGPLYEWDVCAPAAVAESAGLHVSDSMGSELIFNKARPVVPGLLISRPELAHQVMTALRQGQEDHRG